MATVVGVIIVLIASVCAGGEREVDCRELYDWAINDPIPWEDTDTGEPCPTSRYWKLPLNWKKTASNRE